MLKNSKNGVTFETTLKSSPVMMTSCYLQIRLYLIPCYSMVQLSSVGFSLCVFNSKVPVRDQLSKICHNSWIVQDSCMKLHTWVHHLAKMYHKQEWKLLLRRYLVIFPSSVVSLWSCVYARHQLAKTGHNPWIVLYILVKFCIRIDSDKI